MLIVLAVVAGIAVTIGLSLVLKLRSIRTRGFGEGSRLDLPEAGLSLRHPHWWRPARGGVTSAEKRDVVVLKTGHSRGLLRIAAWRPSSGQEVSSSLRTALAEVISQEGLELDDPEIRTTSGVSGTGDPAGEGRAWVASGGRQASDLEQRSYFEVHLISLGGARVLFSYTNSVLQGFLDAYYIEKVLETLLPARFPR